MIIEAFEFDNHPGDTPQVVINENEHYQLEIVLKFKDREVPLIATTRDQWGVFVHVAGATIAQEDGTRSFLDALSKAINELRNKTECMTTEAAKLQVVTTE